MTLIMGKIPIFIPLEGSEGFNSWMKKGHAHKITKHGSSRWSLYYWKNDFQSYFSMKTSKSDLKNGQNPHCYPFREKRGSSHESKSVRCLKLHNLCPFDYILIIEKLIFSQYLTHRALGHLLSKKKMSFKKIAMIKFSFLARILLQ